MAKRKSNKTTKASASKASAKKQTPAPAPIVLKNDFSNEKKLDTTQAAQFLGCSVPLIYAMLRDGRIKTKEEIAKRIYVSRAELQALKDGKKIHPRNGKNKKLNVATQGSQVLLSDANQMVTFEITASAADYNMMSMVLSAQNMTVANWLSKMVSVAADQAKESAKGVVSMGSRS